MLSAVEGRVPLVIELKTRGKNHHGLCLRVMEALDAYEGMYCIESFDPQAVRWFRKNRPDIVRGQLAGSLKKDGNVNGIQEFLLRNLWVNLLSRPDFVAYSSKTEKKRLLSNTEEQVLWIHKKLQRYEKDRSYRRRGHL